MNECTEVKVTDLKPGMMVDMEGDPYADPEDASIEFEFKVVWAVYRAEDAILVHFEDDEIYRFPNDHVVKVERHGLVNMENYR